MQPVPGHPYVRAYVGPDGCGGWKVHCACTACGDQWVKECQWPERSMVWVALYCSKHVHNRPDLYDYWWNRYVVEDQQFKMRQRGY